ncbi:MAG: hypothetical protein ACE5IP_01545 [Terriglobia bacterium]
MVQLPCFLDDVLQLIRLPGAHCTAFAQHVQGGQDTRKTIPEAMHLLACQPVGTLLLQGFCQSVELAADLSNPIRARSKAHARGGLSLAYTPEALAEFSKPLHPFSPGESPAETPGDNAILDFHYRVSV